MEPFSLLKFWRNAAAAAASDVNSPTTNNTNFDVRSRAPETEQESDDDDDDEDSDSFFDLVFTAPDCYNKRVTNAKSCSKGDEYEDSINNLIKLESPPLKPEVFPVDSNSKPQSPISLLKSAPKFRLFFLGFRKWKTEKSEHEETSKSKATTRKRQFNKSSPNEQSKRFTLKCKVEEVPIGSLFSRENSLRSKFQRQHSFDFSMEPSPKDIPMYLKLIKPLYIRASRRYTDKMRLASDQLSTTGSPLSSPGTVLSCSPRNLSDERRGNRGVGFKVVSNKNLGKSRSVPSAVAGMMSSPADRRDDSLLLHNDGIQSAILHCKRSYNNSTPEECSALLRSSHEKSMISAGDLSNEQRNRCCSI